MVKTLQVTAPFLQITAKIITNYTKSLLIITGAQFSLIYWWLVQIAFTH